MSIVKQIHALTEKLTGQTGAGYDITESINDLTKKWTGSSDRGETIAESLDVLVDHAESGGGGSSDFSTCTVTLVNTAVALKVYSVVPQPGYCIISDGELLTSTISDSADSSIELEFMTYKGQSVVNVYSAVDLTVSGNATAEYYDDDPDDTYYEVIITGDCTITAEGTDAVA